MKLTVADSIVRGPVAWLTGRARAWSDRPASVLLLGTGIAAAVLGLLMASPRTLRPSHQYAIGDFATATIRAPWDVSIPDEAATARMRDEAARHAPPVADFDRGPSTAVPGRIVEVFGRARELIARADDGRQVPEAELAKLGPVARRRTQQARAHDADRAVETVVQEMLSETELQLGVLLSPEERTMLAAGRFDRRFEDGLLALLREAYSRPIARDPRPLKDAAIRSQPPAEPPRLILRAGAPTPDRVLQDVAMLDDTPGAVARMRARASYFLPGSLGPEQDVLVGLASRLVAPDTAYDESATAERRTRAAADVLPISLNFRRNQLIVGEGQEVTREALLVLEHLRRQGLPQAFLARAAGVAALTWVLLAAFVWLPHRLGFPRLSLRDAAFVVTTVVAATASFWIWLILADGVSARMPGAPRVALLLLFPVTAPAMLAGLVLPRRFVTGLVAAVAVVTGLLTDLGVAFTAHGFAVGLVAAQLVSPCRLRSCVIRAGVGSGAAAVVSSVGVLTLAAADWDVGQAVAAVAAAFAGAASGGLIALAFSRPVEWAFGYATKLRLVELLSHEHPLLRRFMERAPGTFQHSVAVALLARPAAEAIGADALLVRVGAMYHDVGKMEYPHLFSENQRSENPHDRMAPRDSARAILDHVERGIALLKQFGVGERVTDFVREHQGTGVLTYLEQKARAGGGAVDEADYRYPGPRPRSRETAVLMLADKIEASVRALDAPSPEGYRAVVEATIDQLRSLGQLDESPLTLRDVASLNDAFVSALSDLHHKRPPYAKPLEPAPGAQGPAIHAG